MDIHAKIRKCLTVWMTDIDLWLAMRKKFQYEGSPNTLARERRKVSGIIDRPLINKKGVKYKQFKWSK